MIDLVWLVEMAFDYAVLMHTLLNLELGGVGFMVNRCSPCARNAIIRREKSILLRLKITPSWIIFQSFCQIKYGKSHQIFLFDLC